MRQVSNIQMDGNKITGLADPISAQDAATRAYVAASIVAAGGTTLSGSAAANVGSAAAAGVVEEASRSDHVHALTKAVADALGINAGTVQGNTVAQIVAAAVADVTKPVIDALGVDAATLSGNTFTATVQAAADSVIAGAGPAYDSLLEIQAFLQQDDTDDAALVLAVGAREQQYSQLVGNGVATSIAVTHGLNTRLVHVSVRDAVSYAEVVVDNAATNSGTVTLTFATAPAAGEFVVKVSGVPGSV